MLDPSLSYIVTYSIYCKCYAVTPIFSCYLVILLSTNHMRTPYLFPCLSLIMLLSYLWLILAYPYLHSISHTPIHMTPFTPLADWCLLIMTHKPWLRSLLYLLSTITRLLIGLPLYYKYCTILSCITPVLSFCTIGIRSIDNPRSLLWPPCPSSCLISKQLVLALGLPWTTLSFASTLSIERQAFYFCHRQEKRSHRTSNPRHLLTATQISPRRTEGKVPAYNIWE